jgi:PAS domain S-box-containing protein
MNSVQSQHPINYSASGIVRYAWLPIPIFILLIGILWMADLKIVLEPPYLLPLFNFIFSTAVAFFVSYLAVISFSRNASVTVLMLGSGMLFFGTVSVIAAIAIQIGQINLGITVYNTGVLFSGMCHLLAAAALVIESRVNRNAILILSATYALVLTVIGLLTYAATKDLTPVFFIQGIGPTPFRQAVLGTAVGIHLLSGIIIALVSRRFHWIFGRWYALSLMMIAIGLFGVLIISHVGSPLGWSGRAAQYVGGIYMIVAVLVGARKNGEWDASLQAALKESQERYRMLVEATFEGIVISEEEVIVDVNEQFCRMLGYTESELIGKPISDLIPEKDRKRVVSTILSGQDVTDEHFMLKKDGNILVVESHGRTILRNGRHIRYSAVRDITDRKRSEKALQESEDKFSKAFYNSPTFMFITERDTGIYIETNDAYSALTSFKHEELIGHSSIELGILSSEVRAEIIRHLLKSGRVQNMQLQIVTKSGEIKTRLFSAETFEYKGKPCMIGSGIDITELIQANEALRISEEKYRFLFDSMKEGFCIVEVIFDENGKGIDHRFIEVNQAFEHHTGLNEAVGKTALELVPGLESKWSKRYGRIAASGKAEHFIDDSVAMGRWFEMDCFGVGNPEENRVALLFNDITERKQVEDALRESENRFRMLFEHMAEGFFLAEIICDESGNPVDYQHLAVNPALEYFVGKTRLEVLKSPRPWIEKFGRVALTGKPEKFEGFSVLLNRHFLISAYCPEHGKFACLVQDITDAKRSKQKLIESEERFRTMADGLPLMVWVYDHRNKQLLVNKTYLEFFGVTHEEVNNDRWQILIHPDDADAYLNEFFDCVRSQRPFYGQARVKRSDGQWRWIESWAQPRLSPDGGYMGSVGTSTDITERKQTEEAIKDLTKNLELRVAERTAVAEQRARQLQQLALELSNAEDKERKRMAMILHDDLQQHLGALRFNLFTLLPKDLIDDEVKDRLLKFEDLIDQAIKKTRSLSHELSPPVLHQSGFLAALNWLAKDVQQKHGQQVILKSMPEAEPESTAVSSVLFRSVRELLFNALKHSETKTAFIEADVMGNFISVSVKDHGKGCDVEAVKARTSSAPGFGLFNIEERIKFLGGHFEIDSIPGNGCCVTLRVPKDPESTLQNVQVSTDVIPKKKQQKQPQTADQIRIMLVDDHPSIRQGMSMFLKAITDFELLAEASNGIEAVRMARELKPDVVLMDISMPEMDGIEATAVIKKDHPNIRIIGLSMHEDEKTRERMLSAGASAYLNKAAPVNEIIEVIKNSRTIKKAIGT